MSPQDDVIQRLRLVEGQIRGIRRMVEEGRPCPDVVVQVAAVRSAVGKIGQLMVEQHARQCVADAFRQGRGEEVLEDLLKVFAQTT